MAGKSIPEASVYRMSLYHCYLGELIAAEGIEGRITSRHLAEELGIKEETVRRDLSLMGGVGRPGAGYGVVDLFDALQEFLGLSDDYPTMRVGSAQMLEALSVVFPPDAYGVRPVAYYSENPEDAGKVIHGVEIRHLSEIPEIDSRLGVSVALVATSPQWVQITLDLCAKAGVTGVLLLTPTIKIAKPDSMNIVHVRMPCDIKSLACQCLRPDAVKRDGGGIVAPINDIMSR